MNNVLMEESKRIKIVKDILLRKPKGESGQNPSYEINEYYCYDARKHKNRVECSHPGWGYTDESLWDLGFRSESDVREYIFNKFYKSDELVYEYYLTSGQRAGVTRKTNRLYGRIREALRRVQSSANIPGLYKVQLGYGNNFYFFGECAAEVTSLAEMMLAPMYPDERISVFFVDRAVPGDILDHNVPSFERLSKEIARKKERAEELLGQAKKMESQIEYVKTLITQNLEVAMRVS